MKVKIHEINPDNNFLSSEPAKTLVELSKITKFELPDEIIKKSSRLIISPYKYLGNTDLNILRDKSWGGDLNLRSWVEVDKIINYLEDFKEVSLLGALESLGDIRPVLKALRVWMITGENRKAIFLPNLSSASQYSFREYSVFNLKKLLKHSGFKVANQNDKVVASCSKDYYEKFLKNSDLPQPNIKYVVFTNEHPSYRVTGGVGSYVKESTRLYGSDSAVCMIDDNIHLDQSAIDSNSWFSIQKLIGDKKYSQLLEYDFNNSSAAILESLYQILFLYNDIKFIEGSDYGHLNLTRVIQAKETGLLPDSLKIITVCHGSNIYVDNAAGKYPSKENIPVIQKEAYSVINSDVTIFLTDFVKNLYKNYGIEAKNPVKYRLPINLIYYEELGIKQPVSFKEIKSIYYIGKLSKMKGGDRFLGFVIDLAKTGKHYDIVCASTYTSPESEVQEALKDIANYPNINLVVKPYTRDDLLLELNVRAQDSIAIIPYPADNHPNVILELMLVGMDFIAANSGGIPELIPNKDNFLVDLKVNSIISKFQNVSKDRKQRFKIVKSNRDSYLKEQIKLNSIYQIKNLDKLPWGSNKSKKDTTDKSISVIVPCYNTDFKYIKDLALSLNNQSVKAGEVLFVNDGSTKKDYLKNLTRLLKKENYNFNYKILDKTNGGLSSARNFGLKKAECKYIATIDSDDVIDNYFLESLGRAIQLTNDKSIIGVTPFLHAFYEGKDPTKIGSFHYQYMPYGSNLATAFFPHNTYGSAAAIFNRQKLIKATGGWDESSRSMFEDWALYIRLDSLGYKVNILPVANYFYRVRPDSMLRTYDNREGFKRLMSNYLKLSKYESYLLFSQLFNYYQFNTLDPDEIKQFGLQEAFGTYDTSHISKLVKISKLIKAYDKRMPSQAKKLVAKSSALSLRLVSKIRRAMKSE